MSADDLFFENRFAAFRILVAIFSSEKISLIVLISPFASWDTLSETQYVRLTTRLAVPS